MPLAQALVFASGIWVGNILYHGLVKKDWTAGFFIGMIATVIALPLAMLFMK